MTACRMWLWVLSTVVFTIGCQKSSTDESVAPSGESSRQDATVVDPPMQRDATELADLDKPEEPIDLPTDWQEGDKLRYTLVKSRKRTRGSDTVFDNSSSTDIDIEILETSPAGYLVGWTTGKPTVSGNSNDPLVQQVLNLFSDVQMRLMLDNSISIVGIQNWQEVQSRSVELVEILAKRTEESVGSQAAAGVRQTASMFSSERQVMNLCARDAQMFFLILGGTYEVAPNEYEDRLPNPYGGEPFPSKAAFRLLGIQPDKNQAVVQWTQTLDPVATRRIMEVIVRDMTSRMGANAPDQQILKDFAIDDEATAYVDLETGWPATVKHQRTSRTGGATQVDRIEFNRKS